MLQATQLRHRKAIHSWSTSIGVTAYQALRQKRIRSRTPLEKSEQRVGQQHNCANHREGKLESRGKQFIRIPAENEKRRCREAVWQKCSSFEKVTADED